jgi:hypothetical protein
VVVFGLAYAEAHAMNAKDPTLVTAIEVHRATPYEHQQTTEPVSESWAVSTSMVLGVSATEPTRPLPSEWSDTGSDED